MSKVGYSEGRLEGMLDREGVLDGTSDKLGLPVGAMVGLCEGTLLMVGEKEIVGALVIRAFRY